MKRGPKRKISQADADQIRRDYHDRDAKSYVSMDCLGRLYGVSAGCIQDVIDFKGAYAIDRDYVAPPRPEPERYDSPDTDLQIKYIGACSVIGQLMQRINVNDDLHYSALRAMEDAAEKFPQFELVKTGLGAGRSLEPKR